ncbi:hypothetical protein A8924_6570 [Saccharopolyspora erythraea NRRL 2338]|uniref:Secreted protein n=2 Tax=Saccharopolyspora erythraea TaxID=1836 RepID=A4FMX0_SACEN|nr:hypothetical protein [Saccharopolyspora erythraea]PFG99039.1 hypothetical protein A8924_6570 [Saccharopolyspora erythraea NRRL 2338]QRK89004.1 hypothetical protein JQX30_31165 [Saccharopolyspora erythraea]CAM05395.1 secreted protein [Saccharopolyspora erythraea NRRL 2338]
MRLRTALIAAGVAVATAAVTTPAGQAAAPDSLEAISAEPFALNDQHDTYADRVRALDEKLPNAKVGDVLADTNRTGGQGCSYPGSSEAEGFCWGQGDDSTEAWIPQGLTASWDADPSGKVDGHRALVTSWYEKGGADRGVRVTFANHDDPKKPKYRHAILVAPTADGGIAPVKTHAGGIAWVGDNLYVADTWGGLRVFDLRHIWKGAADPTHEAFKVDGDKVLAADYRYVIPQVGRYCVPSPSDASKCNGDGGSPSKDVLRTSFIGVDRQSGRLVTGEFHDQDTGKRLVRWPLAADGSLKADGGKVKAAEAYRVPHARMQGGVSVGDTFYTTSSENGAPGAWHRMRAGEKPATEGLGIQGPEDMTYDPASKRVWTLSEHANKRAVFPIPGAGG